MLNLTALIVSLLLRQNWLQTHTGALDSHTDTTLRVITSHNHVSNSIFDALLVLKIPRVIIIGTNLTDLPIAYYPEELSTASQFTIKFPRLSILRFTTHAESVFVFLPSAVSTSFTSSIKINGDYKNGQLHGRRPFPFNNSPLRSHYFFVGERIALKCVFKLQQIQLLKYKTGICVEDGRPTSLMVEKYIEGSRESEFVQTKWSEFGSAYQDKFGLIRNRKLVVWSYPNRINIYYNEDGKPSSGLMYNIARSIAEHFNCSMEYRTEGWQNIGQNLNGTWNGSPGALLNNKIDIAMCLSLYCWRQPYYDIPAICFFETFGFISPLPGRAAVYWKALWHLLRPEVFVLICISSLCFTVILYIHHAKQRNKRPNVSNIDRLYLSVIGPMSILTRRPTLLPSGTHILAAFFLYAATVVDVYIQSNLVALLTHPNEEIIPSTAKELNSMRRFSIDYIKYEGTTVEPYLKETARIRPDIKTLLPRVNVLPPQSTVDSLMRTAIGKKTVTLNDQQTSLFDVAANLTIYPGIYPVQKGEILQHLLLGPAVRKYSKLSDIVELNVRRLDQTGHHLRWVQEALELVRRRGAMWMKAEKRTFYRQLKDQVSHAFSSWPKPFALQHLGFSFLCLAVGNFVGILAYIVEASIGVH